VSYQRSAAERCSDYMPASVSRRLQRRLQPISYQLLAALVDELEHSPPPSADPMLAPTDFMEQYKHDADHTAACASGSLRY